MPKKKKITPPKYTVHLTIGELNYEASGDDLQAVILNLKPEKVNVRGIFTLHHEGKVSTLMKNAPFVKAICTNRLRAFYMGKNLLTLLK